MEPMSPRDRPMPLRHNFHSVFRWDLTRKALNLSFEDLSFANFADRKVNATKLGIHAADA